MRQRSGAERQRTSSGRGAAEVLAADAQRSDATQGALKQAKPVEPPCTCLLKLAKPRRAAYPSLDKPSLGNSVLPRPPYVKTPSRQAAKTNPSGGGVSTPSDPKDSRGGGCGGGSRGGGGGG